METCLPVNRLLLVNNSFLWLGSLTQWCVGAFLTHVIGLLRSVTKDKCSPTIHRLPH
ncbi:hypothetical protein D1872_338180 [compost metagenome]